MDIGFGGRNRGSIAENEWIDAWYRGGSFDIRCYTHSKYWILHDMAGFSCNLHSTQLHVERTSLLIHIKAISKRVQN